MRRNQHKPGLSSSWRFRLLGGFFISTGLLFGAGVYATHSTPTTSTDDHTVTVNVEEVGDVAYAASAEADYESEKLPFEDFNAVGIQWTGVNPSGVYFEVRTHGDSGWTNWEELHSMSGESKGGDAADYSTPLLFNKGTKVQFRVYADNYSSVDDVNVLTINTESPFRDGIVDVVTAQGSELDIIKRSEWGADESYAEDNDGDPLWPTVKDPWEKFIIHHTAGTDGGSDPAAAIRAIYYYHAVSLGWGDIGYNFLVDPDGKIYRGRLGGDDVIGGHTYNSETQTNFNEGSMGVAVLGCYENSGACSPTHGYSSTIKNALGLLIGTKAAERNIDPKGSSNFHGEYTKNIIGHTDVDSTYCPGNNIHDKLSNIRTEAESVADEINQTGDYVGVFKKHTFSPATFTGNVEEVTIKFKNTGDRTWKQEDIMLKLYDETGKDQSQYSHNSWEDFFGGFRMNQSKVSPGETASFTFKAKSPSRIGDHKQIAKLFVGKKTRMNGERGVITTRVDATLMGYLTNSTLPSAVLAAWRPSVAMTFRNDGIETWNDRTALFVDGVQVASITSDVLPGEDATFVFTFVPPSSPGTYSIPIELRRDGDVRVPGTRTVEALRVD